MKKIHFSAVEGILATYISEEGIFLPEGFYNNFLFYISNLCVYEEEGQKIRPHIILGYNIGDAISVIPHKFCFEINRGKIDGCDLRTILKPIIPFCINGWRVYINIMENDIEYGIFRGFNGPRSLTDSELLFTQNDNSDRNYGIIEFVAISSCELKIMGIKNDAMIIDCRFTCDEVNKEQCDYELLATDIVKQIEPEDDKSILKRVFQGLFQIAKLQVHGTICMIVDSGYVFPNDFINDGIWLTKPISLSEYALQTETGIESEKYYGLSRILLNMMNIDGITVIDDKGQIRGFNIFISQSKMEGLKVSGGARRRAAQAILKSNDSMILGVYFQSQDGNNFYERMS